jgi:hypothetical protein
MTAKTVHFPGGATATITYRVTDATGMFEAVPYDTAEEAAEMAAYWNANPDLGDDYRVVKVTTTVEPIDQEAGQ